MWRHVIVNWQWWKTKRVSSIFAQQLVVVGLLSVTHHPNPVSRCRHVCEAILITSITVQGWYCVGLGVFLDSWWVKCFQYHIMHYSILLRLPIAPLRGSYHSVVSSDLLTNTFHLFLSFAMTFHYWPFAPAFQSSCFTLSFLLSFGLPLLHHLSNIYHAFWTRTMALHTWNDQSSVTPLITYCSMELNRRKITTKKARWEIIPECRGSV